LADIDPDAFEADCRKSGVDKAVKNAGIPEMFKEAGATMDANNVRAAVEAWLTWREVMRSTQKATSEHFSGRRDDDESADGWVDAKAALRHARDKADEAGIHLPGLWPQNS
jgi:hypothetical protein